MKRAFASLLLLPLLAMPASGASAMDAEMTFAADFTTMTISASVSTDGQEAADMRASFDAMGDNDGQATQAEADAFFAQFEAMMKQEAGEEMDIDDFTMDGNAATGVTVTEISVEDVDGSVESTSPITLVMAMRATLNPESGDTHTLVMKGDSESDPSEMEGSFKIRAPSGYVIESHNAGPGASLSGDKRVLTLDAEDMDATASDGRIVFAKAGSAKAPGAGVLSIVVVLGAAVLLRRRND